jgi:hypothetical protein
VKTGRVLRARDMPLDVAAADLAQTVEDGELVITNDVGVQGPRRLPPS